MRVVQVPFGYYPDPPGGTEIYVDAVSRILSGQGYEVSIAAPGKADEDYFYEGLPVHRFAVDPERSLEAAHGDGDRVAASSFAALLDRIQPDLVHLHAYSPAVSLLAARAVSERGIPLVFTYHTPTVSCMNGTLLRWGHDVCDGVLRLDLCTRCALHSMGIPRPGTEILSRAPAWTGKALARIGGPNRAVTALRFREFTRSRQESLRAFLELADHVVAVSEWVRDVLIRNGVQQQKMSLSRHGISLCQSATNCPSTAGLSATSPLRIAYLGRLHPMKGIDTLISALSTLPLLHIELDIYSVVQGDSDIQYASRLRAMAQNDRRVKFLSPIPHGDVVATLRDYHLLAVPSHCLETGPLVALEAFAAGTPVLGSNLGGISELVTDGINGLLVAHANIEAWAATLNLLARDAELVERLRAGVSPPRPMQLVAAEMMSLYRSLHVGPHRQSRNISALSASSPMSEIVVG